MKRLGVVAIVVVLLVIGAGVAYLYLPRRIIVEDGYDPSIPYRGG